MKRLEKGFFIRDALEVAPDLIGAYLCIKQGNQIIRKQITEVEAYCGESDLACHASKGRTKRTETLYLEGGHIYTYLIYGIYVLMNIVVADENNPQAVLIRGLDDLHKPGILTKQLNIDMSYNKISLISSDIIWIEKDNTEYKYKVDKRIGIDYAKEYKDKLWRYILIK